MFKKTHMFWIPVLFFILGIIIAYSFFPLYDIYADPISAALNSEYSVEEQPIRLKDGISIEQLSPMSPACITTTVYSIPVRGCISGSGNDDAALILKSEPGGEGTRRQPAFVLGEEPDGQGGRTFQGSGEPLEVHDVDPDSDDHEIRLLARRESVRERAGAPDRRRAPPGARSASRGARGSRRRPGCRRPCASRASSRPRS